MTKRFVELSVCATLSFLIGAIGGVVFGRYCSDDSCSTSIAREDTRKKETAIAKNVLDGAKKKDEPVRRKSTDTRGDFRDSKWKMTKKEVVSSEGETLGDQGNLLYGKAEINGYDAVMTFDFLDDELYSGCYLIVKHEVEVVRYYRIFQEFSTLLEKRYGEPESTDHVRAVGGADDGNRDPESIGKGLILNTLVCTSKWKTQNSAIRLHADSVEGGKYGRQFRLTITYETADSDMVERAKNAVTSEKLKGL